MMARLECSAPLVPKGESVSPYIFLLTFHLRVSAQAPPVPHVYKKSAGPFLTHPPVPPLPQCSRALSRSSGTPLPHPCLLQNLISESVPKLRHRFQPQDEPSAPGCATRAIIARLQDCHGNQSRVISIYEECGRVLSRPVGGVLLADLSPSIFFPRRLPAHREVFMERIFLFPLYPSQIRGKEYCTALTSCRIYVLHAVLQGVYSVVLNVAVLQKKKNCI